MAKICPKCHASQPDGVEYCPVDGTHLQVPPSHPVAAHGPSGDRQFQATLMGVGGDQAQKLAAALDAHEHEGAADATQAFDLSALQRPQLVRAVPPPPPQKTIPPIQRPVTSQLKPVPAPMRPVSAAVTAVPVAAPPPAAPVAVTLAKIIENTGALPTNLAVARICDVAELLARARPATAATPAHVAYGDTTGSGKPRWTERGILDPGYLAQYRPPDLDQGATPATDVYILGCFLFEALTGKAPFRGKTVEEIARKQAVAAAPAVRQIKTDCDLPPALEIELQRALKKRPGDRHPSVAAFAEAIRHAVRDDDRSTTALDVSESAYLQALLQSGQSPAQQSNGTPWPPGAPPVKALVPPTQSAPPPAASRAPAPGKIAEAAPPPPAAGRTGLVLGLVAAGVVVIGGGVFLALRGGTPPVAPIAIAPAPEPTRQPDVVQPDAQSAPDIQPDVLDVAEEPDVQFDTDKPKLKPLAHKPEVKLPEKLPDEKPPEKKPDINRPPVF